MPQRYRIHIRQRAVKVLRSLPTPDKMRIRKAIDKLADDPRPPGVRKLADKYQLYRLRIGYYWIIYQIKDRELLVLVVNVGHRRDIYRR